MIEKFLYLLAFTFTPAAIPLNNIVTLQENNFVSLQGEINQDSSNDFIKQIHEIPRMRQIYVVIDSPGGSVMDAQRIQDALNIHPNHVCVAKQAISAAFMIFQSCKTRLVMSYSVLMQHEAAMGLPPMSVPNLKSFYEFMLRMLEQEETKEAQRLKLTLAEFRAKIHHDWWLYGHDIIKNHAADALVSVVCSKDLTDKKVRKNKNTPFGSVIAEVSACPLLQ